MTSVSLQHAAPMPHHRPHARVPFVLALLCLGACDSSSDPTTPIRVGPTGTQLVVARARVDSPFQFAELALRDGRNLGVGRVSERAGTERHVRLHPDGVQVVFARQRVHQDPTSRELFVSTIDGSAAEVRLTQNGDFDDEPVWSPDGSVVLFCSERSGTRALWTMAATGGGATPFLVPPGGSADGEPDWHRPTDRVVWSRRVAAGHCELWHAQGNGSGDVRLTDGGTAPGADGGDVAPAFAPDGSRIAFVRSTAGGRSLCFVDVATGVVTERLPTTGDLSLPRWSPAGDQILFGLAEPAAGRDTLRLCTLPAAGGEPVLLWPDERWQLEGVDVLPTLPALGTPGTPTVLDVTRADLEVAFGSGSFGARHQLAAADDDEFVVLTGTTVDGGSTREVAGLRARFDLPVANATDVLELRVRAVARTSRAGSGSVLRLSIHNPVDERFDTVVELPVAATTASTLSFATSSLRHVSREKQLRVTVIGDLPAGARAELRVDLLEVVLVARPL
jgi:hypothetical protein